MARKARNRREWRKVKDKVDRSCKEDELPLSVWQGRQGIEENGGRSRTRWIDPVRKMNYH